MKRWIFCVFLLSLFSTQAMAAFMLEPYFGTIVNTKTEFDGEDKAVTGTAYGARAGFQNVGFMLGIDYQMASPSIADVDYTVGLTNYGLFVGYDFPFMLRVWGTYVMSGAFSLDGDWGAGGEGEVKYTTMTGTKFGIGYKIVPFVSLNLEMASLAYDDAEFEGEDISSSVEGDSLSMYVLSISFPFSI